MARMHLPLHPPLGPMLAKSVKSIPEGDYLYEPKFDGFRAIAFRDGDEVEISSRGEKPLTRYFPEVVAALKQNLPDRCVVDGEVVIATDNNLDFEALLQRIHPAASRVNKLAEETPASFVAFDLLATEDESLLDRPFSERRERLTTLLGDVQPPVYVTPATDNVALAQEWFEVFEGAGHFPFNHDPGRFVSVLEDFIASTEPAELDKSSIETMLRRGPVRSAA